jgi:hypothetical protein
LSNLADPLRGIEGSVRLSGEAAAKVVATSAEIIEDVGEISRQNMLLVEELVASVRTLQQAHQAHQAKVDVVKLPLHRRASPAQRRVLGIAAVIGVLFTAYLIGFVQGFPEGCARFIWDALAHRSA